MGNLITTLTDEEFDAAIEGGNFGEKAKVIGRRILVGEEKATALAEEFGVTRGAVYGWRNAIYAAHLKKNAYPPGWVTKKLTAPRAMIASFEKQIAAARSEYFAEIAPVELSNSGETIKSRK